jgi:hypothetical protein
MRIFRVRVTSFNCTQCLSDLIADCRSLGLPLPTNEYSKVPESWLTHECPHQENGLVIELEPQVSMPEESQRWKNEDEIEDPEWRNNLDATKGIGYPAREEGHYGSYPGHDGFDDESKP